MSYNKKSVEDIQTAGRKVIVRCDFNVPLDQDGVITDDKRIVAHLPTIHYLLEQKAAVILCSHLGRPKGKIKKEFSLRPVAERLSQLLGQEVKLAEDVVGPSAKALAAAVKPGEAILLENVRFQPEEEKNDPAFARELASLGDIYVDDAFGTAHRAHASISGIAHYLPSVCGFLIQKEISVMGKILDCPDRPFVAILGGAKVADKIDVIRNLIDQCDAILIGGGMSYTFLKSKGQKIGTSLCEESKLGLASEILEEARQKGVNVLLPVDMVCADRFSAEAQPHLYQADHIPDNQMGLDIGPETIQKFKEVLESAGTVFWNGPMGVFEFNSFAAGTRAIAEIIAESQAISIIGGGDSAAAVDQWGYADRMTHVSTGGGASLKFLQGLDLPGITCLEDKLG